MTPWSVTARRTMFRCMANPDPTSAPHPGAVLLTDEQHVELAALVAKHGLNAAARMVGISREAAARALARSGVRRGTLSLIVSKLVTLRGDGATPSARVDVRRTC